MKQEEWIILIGALALLWFITKDKPVSQYKEYTAKELVDIAYNNLNQGKNPEDIKKIIMELAQSQEQANRAIAEALENIQHEESLKGSF